MIETYMHDGNWRIRITGEEFQFTKFEDMNNFLKGLLEIKDVNGRGLKNG